MQPVFAPRTSRARVSPRLSALLACICIPLAIGMAFFVAQTAVVVLAGAHGQQLDVTQKIFYLHVPIAFAAYLAFMAGAWNAVLYLFTGNLDYDIRSYVGIHVGVVFGTLVLITGSLWARAAWGVWWQWGDRQLLVFLLLYLYYVAYFMMRFSVDAGEHRARLSAVFTLLGAVLVPVSFLAVRISQTLIHPTVITSRKLEMTDKMGVTFLIATIGFLSLCIWMMQAETAAKLLASRGWATRDPAPGSEKSGAQPIAEATV